MQSATCPARPLVVPCCLAEWLTFWFVYSIVAFAKSILDYVSVIIPFYEEAYIAFLLFLGCLGGADVIYSQFLRPFLKEHEALIDEKCVARPRRILRRPPFSCSSSSFSSSSSSSSFSLCCDAAAALLTRTKPPLFDRCSCAAHAG
jgi:hypothetical protein